MTPAPRIDHYDWAGGREAMLRYGPEGTPTVVVALPLFEEANRTRAFASGICRALAARGVGSVLPDMPGQGDSVVPLETVTLGTLQAAHRELIDHLWAGGRHTYAIGIRSGALLDSESHIYGRWHLSPQNGSSLVRELTRMREAALHPPTRLQEGWFFDALDAEGNDVAIEIAGNVIAPAVLGELLGYVPSPTGPTRTVRLLTDPAPADRKVEGAPLWRRSEPDNDADLARLLADDIADWIATCVA